MSRRVARPAVMAVAPLILLLALAWILGFLGQGRIPSAAAQSAGPAPLLEQDGQPVDWWFVFKFNTKARPACAAGAKRHCIFGGDVQEYSSGFSQQFLSTVCGA